MVVGRKVEWYWAIFEECRWMNSWICDKVGREVGRMVGDLCGGKDGVECWKGSR